MLHGRVVFSLRVVVGICLGMSFLSPVPLWGQATQGSIRGLVADPAGGIVPGASVTATSMETGFERSVVTNDQGLYLIPQLRPGVYLVSAEMPGFKKFVQRGVTVHVNEDLLVDIVLELGEITEQVEVTGETLQLDTASASLRTLVSQQAVNDLPLDGRHYTQLILLTSGASDQAADQSQSAVAGTGALSLAVNGQRPRANRYTLGGIYNEELMRQTPGLAPPIDAIREFTVETQSNSAAADAPGAGVNVELRSGTNEFHGTLWEFHRNDNLDANFFFANRAGQEKPKFLQNQFGFSLGGPVVRNHTFVFGSYEGFRSRRGLARLATVPTAAMKQGDFSGLAPIFDPDTTRPDPSDPGRLIRDPFENNQIPAHRINPASKLILDAFYPDPNLPGLTANLINPKPLVNDRDQFMVRFDTRATDDTQVWVHYGYSQIDQATPGFLPVVENILAFRFQNTGVNLVHAYSPTSILSGRVGYARVLTSDIPVKPITRSEFFQGGNVSLFQTDVVNDAFVGISIAGIQAPGGGSSDRNRIDNTYQGAGSFEHIRGSHKFTFGTDIRRYQFLIDPPNPHNGSIGFDATLTQDPLNRPGTGLGFASFLLGYPVTISRGFGDARTDGRQWGLHFYIQDEWRVSPRLTLNLGLRYQYDSPAVDKLDRLGTVDFIPIEGAGFPQNPGSGRVNLLWASTNPFTGEPANVRRSIMEPEYNDFAPRLGIAYKIDDDTVLRMGYGIFYDSVRFQELQDMRKHFPFNAQQVLAVNRDATPAVNWQTDIPFDSNAAQPGGWPQNRTNRHGYSQQWNLSVQRQLLSDVLVEAAYLGARNLKQIRYYSFNDPRPGPGDPSQRRPFLELSATEIGNNDTNASYNALQLKLNKRFTRGLSILGMYTWSHTIDDQSTLEGNQIQDGFNTRASRGPAVYDLRHNFVTSYIYQLPLGAGRGLHLSGWADQVLGHWQMQGIVRLTSGPPVNVILSLDNANIGMRRNQQRPNLVGDPHSGITPGPDEWFNTAAFELPPQFTFGNAGRHIVRADGRANVDFSLFKSFLIPPIGEQGRLEFRAEFFNLFNHQDFARPNGSFGTGNFGRVFSTTNPRDIQFALKLYF